MRELKGFIFRKESVTLTITRQGTEKFWPPLDSGRHKGALGP